MNKAIAFLCVLVIFVFGIAMGGFIESTTTGHNISVYKTREQKLEKQLIQSQIKHTEDLNTSIKAVTLAVDTIKACNIRQRPDHLETGLAILQIYASTNKQEVVMAEQDFRKYINECSTSSLAWFCHQDLLHRINIRRESIGYFLVIDELNMPTLYNLCGFMWNDHRPCKQFDENHPSF